VTSSLAVFEAAIRVKSTHRIKSCLKTIEKKQNMEIKEKDRVNIEFTAC